MKLFTELYNKPTDPDMFVSNFGTRDQQDEVWNSMLKAQLHDDEDTVRIAVEQLRQLENPAED